MLQVWSSPNLQNLDRACSEAIGQSHDRYHGSYHDMDRAASMDHYKHYPPMGEQPPQACYCRLAHGHLSARSAVAHSVQKIAPSVTTYAQSCCHEDVQAVQLCVMHSRCRTSGPLKRVMVVLVVQA